MSIDRLPRPRMQLWMLSLMIAILLTGFPGALLPEIAFLHLRPKHETQRLRLTFE